MYNNMKMKILKNYNFTMLFYGSETWSVTLSAGIALG